MSSDEGHIAWPVRAPTSGLASIEQSLHRHQGLIHAVIRREGSGSLTYEEALQAGRIGLWRAILMRQVIVARYRNQLPGRNELPTRKLWPASLSPTFGHLYR